MYADTNPTWVQSNIDDFLSDADNREIIAFYLYKTPNTKASVQAISLTSYGWIQDIYSDCNNFFVKHYIEAQFSGNFYVKKRGDFDSQIATSMLEPFPPAALNKQIAVLTQNKSNCNSFFAHMRNAFAHGRFVQITNADGEKMFIFEDANPSEKEHGTGKPALTGRLVLSKKTLLDIKHYVQNKSYEEADAMNQCIEAIKDGHNTKTTIMAFTGWDNSTYDYVTGHLRKEGRISFPKDGKMPKDQKWIVN